MPHPSPPRARHTPQPSLHISRTTDSHHSSPSSLKTISLDLGRWSNSSRSRKSSASSLSTPMWLGRSSSQAHSSATKPARTSEPKVPRSIEVISARTGVLGSGATIVRTAEEALRDTPMRPSFDGKMITPSRNLEVLNHRRAMSEETLIQPVPSIKEEYISPPCTPPLSPVHEPSDHGEEHKPRGHPPKPDRALLALPSQMQPSSNRIAEESISFPELSQQFMAISPRPTFEPVLISNTASNAIDLSKVIVMLETCTTTYKTMLSTITSRASLLATYLKGLLSTTQSTPVEQSLRPQSAASVYSTASAEDDDRATYQRYLASQGLVSPCPTIHIFLDRPSAPYVHVLNYLRSASCTSTVDEILPRSVQLQSSSYTRLEALLELRDEAAYLELQDLHRLCTEELRVRQVPRAATRAANSGPPRSQQASIVNLLQSVQDDIQATQRTSTNSASHHKGAPSLTNHPSETPSHSNSQRPPTPQSWRGCSRGRSVSQNQPPPIQPPPGAGWF
ncbi:hypothetical protein AX16_003209 [Volvariella volvacea WC 439]|nr:hypothetical protein AX16_003209 [Volvariella volvacea WC 439]